MQNLIRVRRNAENDYQQEDAIPVRFVPLIGADGRSSSRTYASAKKLLQIMCGLPNSTGQWAGTPLPELRSDRTSRNGDHRIHEL